MFSDRENHLPRPLYCTSRCALVVTPQSKCDLCIGAEERNVAELKDTVW